MTREEAFRRLEQMYDFYAHAIYPLKGDAEAIKVALLVMAQDRSAHITREQVEKMRSEWKHRFTTDDSVFCTSCKTTFRAYYDEYNFCPDCGAPMTCEAVDILWKRLEAMQDEAETV